MLNKYIATQTAVQGVKVTVCLPGPAPRKNTWQSKHRGRSESAVARYTGRYNHS
jgi:hypothetical protein